jgi:hypothetical protein
MTVPSYVGVVENGRVRLPAEVVLPEKAKVYVIVPLAEPLKTEHVRSPRLADPSQAAHFELEVSEKEHSADDHRSKP